MHKYLNEEFLITIIIHIPEKIFPLISLFLTLNYFFGRSHERKLNAFIISNTKINVLLKYGRQMKLLSASITRIFEIKT